jgi:hypothetical protein
LDADNHWFLNLLKRPISGRGITTLLLTKYTKSHLFAFDLDIIPITSPTQSKLKVGKAPGKEFRWLEHGSAKSKPNPYFPCKKIHPMVVLHPKTPQSLPGFCKRMPPKMADTTTAAVPWMSSL